VGTAKSGTGRHTVVHGRQIRPFQQPIIHEAERLTHISSIPAQSRQVYLPRCVDVFHTCRLILFQPLDDLLHRAEVFGAIDEAVWQSGIILCKGTRDLPVLSQSHRRDELEDGNSRDTKLGSLLSQGGAQKDMEHLYKVSEFFTKPEYTYIADEQARHRCEPVLPFPGEQFF